MRWRSAELALEFFEAGFGGAFAGLLLEAVELRIGFGMERAVPGVELVVPGGCDRGEALLHDEQVALEEAEFGVECVELLLEDGGALGVPGGVFGGDAGGFVVVDLPGEACAVAAAVLLVAFAGEFEAGGIDLGLELAGAGMGAAEVAAHGGGLAAGLRGVAFGVEFAAEVLHGISPGLLPRFEHREKVTQRRGVW